MKGRQEFLDYVSGGIEELKDFMERSVCLVERGGGNIVHWHGLYSITLEGRTVSAFACVDGRSNDYRWEVPG